MVKKLGATLRNPLFGKISADLVSARDTLRDRLVPSVEKDFSKAFAFRKAKRFQPAPGINLVGFGIGEKVTSGKPTGEMCLKVLVAKKYPKGKVDPSDRIPAAIDGIPIDIEGVGYPRKFLIPQRQRQRPIPGGVSVGLDFNAVNFHFAGTLGVVVVDREGERTLYALSNNHVLADENRVSPGAGVVQPGTLDGGRNIDRIGQLTRYVPLKFDNRRNWMDAALAEFGDGVAVVKSIFGVGSPRGAGTPSLNLLVRKSGRTTGVTEGIVRAVRFDLFNVEYDQGLVRVDGVMVIQGIAGPFSRPGDSGSAIVDHQGRVIGLLFAGSDVVTFAMPIRRVLRRFRVRLAT